MKTYKFFIKEAKIKANRGSLPELYIDMDGVLVDFNSGVSKILGYKLKKERRLNNQEWEIIKKQPKFWEILPPFNETKRFWSFLNKHKPHILSAAPPDWKEAKKEKNNWLKKHIGKVGGNIHIVVRKEKQNFAKGNLLVDDLAKNIHEWEQAGGTGILHISVKDTIKKLKELGY